ncbi:MAG: hypothetical protein R3267_06250 [Paenisporosarcina sp.]|nr:hypothetical protein [Paenisporosarcina sp.]
METLIVIIILTLIVSIITVIAVKGTAENMRRNTTVKISKPLTTPQNGNSAASQYISLFNDAWPHQTESQISKDILKDFPNISANDLPGLWYELKKYLYLASLVKNLPMFSNDVDLVWHEFLEHEDEYNSFCLRFCGHIIEHKPHDKPKHLPKERAFFDILYRGMFHLEDNNYYWGDFFSEKQDVVQWTEKIEKDMDYVLDTTHNRKTNPVGKKVYREFLEFGQREIKKSYIKNNTSIQNEGLLPFSLLAFSGYLYMDEDKKENDTYFNGDNKDNSLSDNNSHSSCSTSSCSSCSSCSS